MHASRTALFALAAIGLPAVSTACSGSTGGTPSGLTDFVSSPAGGAGGGLSSNASFGGPGARTSQAGAPSPTPPQQKAPPPKTPPPGLSQRTVQETDL